MVDVTITLIRLAFVAAVLTVALEQIFDTPLYQKYLGKGLNGEGSRFMKNFELRPWISTIGGMFLAFAFGLTALQSGLGSEFINAETIGTEAEIVDKVLTGLIVGGGTKTIKKLANQFVSTQKSIQKEMQG